MNKMRGTKGGKRMMIIITWREGTNNASRGVVIVFWATHTSRKSIPRALSIYCGLQRWPRRRPGSATRRNIYCRARRRLWAASTVFVVVRIIGKVVCIYWQWPSVFSCVARVRDQGRRDTRTKFLCVVGKMTNFVVAVEILIWSLWF